MAWLRQQLEVNAYELPEEKVAELLRRQDALEDRAVRDNVIAELRYAVTGEPPLEVALKARGPGRRRTVPVGSTVAPRGRRRKPSAFRRAQELLR